MLSLKKVRKKDRDLLWNINQKYMYEILLQPAEMIVLAVRGIQRIHMRKRKKNCTTLRNCG